MKSIDSVSKIKKLADWFKTERYLYLKKAPMECIEHELSVRAELWNSVINEKGIKGDYPNELFDNFSTYEAYPMADEDGIDCNIKPLDSEDVLEMADRIKLEGIGNAEIHKTLRYTTAIDGEGICLGISLSYATNNEILASLKKALPIIRSQMGIIEPKRYRTEEKYLNLFLCGVFEYVDLSIWAYFSGYKITRTQFSLLICGGKFTPSQIDKTVKYNVKHAMSFDYGEQFRLDIINNNL